MQQSQLFNTDGPIAGVDEAGRGPLAGPVVAAAVILVPGQDTDMLVDSKKLTALARERIARHIMSKARAWSVAWADRAEIDTLNILHATMLAMRRAVIGLPVTPSKVQVDGNRVPDLNLGGQTIAGEAIVGGDDKVAAISAASILAKTARDRIMVAMDEVYPGYEFSRHKGYGTELHRARLIEIGPSAIHRMSFAPVRKAS